MRLGDQTLVGEKGLLLSGGQKARLTLARYSVMLSENLSLSNEHLKQIMKHVLSLIDAEANP